MRILVIGCHNTQNDKDNIEKALWNIKGIVRPEITFEFSSHKFEHLGGRNNVDLEEFRKFDIIVLFCTEFTPSQIQRIQDLSKEGILVIDVARCTGLADYQLANIRRTALIIDRVERRFLNKFVFSKE